ncbi:hypothetical protein HY745_10775 [Candidatus Desantisbacteria bacterium]|nr:hypothetical protein [Candidatus Desantisbacteria bacterium]
MIDFIRDTLNNQSGLSAWQIRYIKSRSSQLYIIDHDTECMRTVDIKKFVITVFVERETGGKKVMGESEFLFVQGEDLKSKLDAAVSMAGLVDNEPFILPGPAQSYKAVKTADLEIKNNPDKVIMRIQDDIFKAVDREKGISLSTAEIYVNLFNIEILNSRGLEVAREDTEIYVEFVLMAGKKEHEEVESGKAQRARFYSNLKIDDAIKEYAGYALDSLSAELPPTGKFDVVFSGEALDTLFNWFITQSSGAAKYERWSLFEEGRAICQGMNSSITYLFFISAVSPLLSQTV